MSRLLVGLVIVLVACSDATSTAPFRPRNNVTSTSSASYPFVQGAHVAAMPGLDASDHAINALNDWDEFAGLQSMPGGVGVTPMHYQTTRGLTVYSPATFDAAAMGVNNKGQVVIVNDYDFGPPWSAAIWDWFGNVRQLPLLSTYGGASATNWCEPWAINNSGEVAGSCQVDGQPVQLATIWKPDGRPWALRVNGNGPFVEQIHSGVGLSDSGYVTGQLKDGTGFVFTPRQQLEVLPKYVLNGKSNWVQPSYVNNIGQATGHATILPANPSWCTDHALAWLTPGTITDLGFCGEPKGITDDGIIIATLEAAPTDSSGQAHLMAVIWTAKKGVQRLPGLEGGSALNLDNSTVSAINHRHQIVGVWWTHDGAPHFVLWTLPATL